MSYINQMLGHNRLNRKGRKQRTQKSGYHHNKIQDKDYDIDYRKG